DKPLRVTFATGAANTASYDAKNHAVEIQVASGASTEQVAAAVNDNEQLHGILSARATGTVPSSVSQPESLEIPAWTPGGKVRSFNIVALAATGQNTDLFDVRYKISLFGSAILDGSLQHW